MTKKRINNRVAELLALKARAENRRITQRAAAEEMGMPPSTFARWYHNDITRRDDEQVLILLSYFGCGIDDLLVVEEYDDQGNSKTPLLATA
jgi:transcriptional regulator with XRE-family HTH domain